MEIFGIPHQAFLGQIMLGLVNGAFYAVLSLGLAIIFGLLRIVNFAHGAFFMAGAFVAFLIGRHLGLGYWPAMIIAPLVVGIVGILFERFGLRRIYGLDPLYGLLLTFGLVLVLEGSFRVAFGSSGQAYATPSGVNGTDPFIIMPFFLKELKELGFSGVQNFPTVGIIDGTFRVSLEETGINFSSEIDMIREAHQLDMLTTPYVFSVDEAIEMAKAGADLIVPHMGVTTGGTIGATSSKTLEESVRLIDEWAEAARRVRKDVVIIAHGGPISSPADADYVMRNSEHCNGFYGASSVERIPVEKAIVDHIKTFKSLTSLKDKGGKK